ncbi:MAG: hypothetical protein K6T77_03920 [candidate division WOR-3 bacterium]|jgi:hypothetical protein|nr:hypothetical protein [candidate division WOR-3 bacterium]MCR4424451.1 hypothetical protein [candidate division WOR-3 bacterium]MDH7519700.1 hypothetical protein [bacterium]
MPASLIDAGSEDNNAIPRAALVASKRIKGKYLLIRCPYFAYSVPGFLPGKFPGSDIRCLPAMFNSLLPSPFMLQSH